MKPTLLHLFLAHSNHLACVAGHNYSSSVEELNTGKIITFNTTKSRANLF